MCITWAKFLQDACELVERSTHMPIDHKWKLEGTPSATEESSVYLAKLNQVRFFAPTMTHTETLENEFEELEEHDLAQAPGSLCAAHLEPFTYDFHIVFCTTFQVPVLFFNAYDKNRRLLLLEEVRSFSTQKLSCNHFSTQTPENPFK